MAFLGDGATSEGDAHEAMNLAAVDKVPCVFFVQNNQWAISVPVSRQHAGPSIAHRASGYGMAGVMVDGNDVLACYAVMSEAAERARAGEGPTLIEAVTYRMGPHTTSDDPTRYQPAEELDEWAARDPITRYRNYLRRIGVLTDRLETAGERPLRAAARRTSRRGGRRPAIPMWASCSTPSMPRSRRCSRPSASSCSPRWRRRSEMTQIIERPPKLTDLPEITTLTMAQAINRALHDAMAADERVLVFGEDVATLGGVFRVTEGLSETFGAHGVSTPRWPSPRSSASPSAWRSAGSCRYPRSSSTASPIRRSTRWSATWPSIGCAREAKSTCR